MKKKNDAQLWGWVFLSLCAVWPITGAIFYFDSSIAQSKIGFLIVFLTPFIAGAALLSLPLFSAWLVFYEKNWRRLAWIWFSPTITIALLVLVSYYRIIPDQFLCSDLLLSVRDVAIADSDFHPHRFVCDVKKTVARNSSMKLSDLSPLVLQVVKNSIPIGMPFSDAEDRLRRSGFQLNANPYFRSATLTLASRPLSLFFVNLHVDLFQKTSGETLTVSRVEATISVDAP